VPGATAGLKERTPSCRMMQGRSRHEGRRHAPVGSARGVSKAGDGMASAPAEKRAAPQPFGWLGRLWLLHWSAPREERAIHRFVVRSLRQRPTQFRILELGLGRLRRSERLLRLAAGLGARGGLQYVGIDRFEGRLESDPPGVTLKHAFRTLNRLGKVQLVPGNVDTTLSRLCNHLGFFDLVLVSADADSRHVERSWFFIHRLVRPGATVMIEAAVGGQAAGGRPEWRTVSSASLGELAGRAVTRQVA